MLLTVLETKVLFAAAIFLACTHLRFSLLLFVLLNDGFQSLQDSIIAFGKFLQFN